MKNQALFSLKDISKKIKCRLLQFLFCALMVNNGGGSWVSQSITAALDNIVIQKHADY